ncbi:Bifunctional solanapyrone synthase [Apiospora arundinis]
MDFSSISVITLAATTFSSYGSAVRIAPDELAFFTPQAFVDIYSPQHKNLEEFVKTDLQDPGKDLGDLI